MKLRSNTILVALFALALGGSIVYAVPPVADADGPYSGEVGETITLDGSASWDPDGDPTITMWEWDIDNDGQHDDAIGETVGWSWGSPGIYVVSLRVTDETGATDVDETTVTISRASLPSVPLMAQAALPTAIVCGAAVTYWKRKRSRP